MIWRCTIIPQILASPSFPTCHEMECNIAMIFKDIYDILRATTQNMLHAVIMFDKISVEKCLHWDDKTILGVCCEHGQDTSLEFTSKEDLQTLWEEVQCGKIHLAYKVHIDLSSTSFNNLICHASSLIGNCWCDRAPKSSAAALQCTSHAYLQEL